MPETTTPQLSESEVLQIEKDCRAVLNPLSTGSERLAACLTLSEKAVPALTRDWRALKARNSELESSVTFWQAEALLEHFCSEHAKNTRQRGHYCTICTKPFVMSVPQGERPPKYNDLTAENAALREQLGRIASFANHADECEWWDAIPRTTCSCGLADIVEKIK